MLKVQFSKREKNDKNQLYKNQILIFFKKHNISDIFFLNKVDEVHFKHSINSVLHSILLKKMYHIKLIVFFYLNTLFPLFVNNMRYYN